MPRAGAVQPQAAAGHWWGAFFGLVQRKRPRPRKENRFATVSHDPAATQPVTVSHRAERTCVSAQPSSADACNVGIRCSDDVMLQHIPRKGRRGRRPLQSVCAVQPRAAAALLGRFASSPDVMGAAEGGCCTPGALCVVASCTSFASGQARSLSRFAAPPSPCKGKPLHGNPCSKKASQTPKGNPLCYRIPRPSSHTAGYRIVQGRTD